MSLKLYSATSLRGLTRWPTMVAAAISRVPARTHTSSAAAALEAAETSDAKQASAKLSASAPPTSTFVPRDGNMADRALDEAARLLSPYELLAGPPSPDSNVRPVRLGIPADETRAERLYREYVERVSESHHEWWKDSNAYFAREQARVMQLYTPASKVGEDAVKRQKEFDEAMSEFYKHHLERTHKRHRIFYWKWVRECIGMSTLGTFAAASRLFVDYRKKRQLTSTQKQQQSAPDTNH
ncbi:hypothetical protein GQ42DRAFT_179777 [Ramicandelaber brevisporus]|nr:hypothetical protein GQ42DRAFT_179777 [Ramicandelaber brevisporus]